MPFLRSACFFIIASSICESTEKAISFGEQEAILQSALTKMPEGFDKELKGHILRRRSYRHFSSEKVDRSLIEEALELASWAPSAKNQHPTKWIIIDDSETIEKIMAHILRYAEENNVSPEKSILSVK